MILILLIVVQCDYHVLDNNSVTKVVNHKLCTFNNNIVILVLYRLLCLFQRDIHSIISKSVHISRLKQKEKHQKTYF